MAKALKHQKGIAHLKKDKTLADIIRSAGPIRLKQDKDLYLALCKSIVSQQLSVKAAATIWSRFLDLFPDAYPSTELVLRIETTQLRAAGLSFQKASYIKNIARFSIEQGLDYKRLKKLEDEDLIAYLTQIKGVGRWTVEMILMFSLGRENILPKDDLGIQNAMIRLYRIRATSKKQLHAAMEKKAAGWVPYRTMACMFLWKHKDNLTK